MQNTFGLNGKVALFVIIAILTAVSSITWAATNDTIVKPLVLRIIMRQMSGNMQTVTDAISRQDWQQVAETTPLIADHPQPPLAEKLRIVRFAGSDADRFKEFDRQTHQAAVALGEVAEQQDGKSTIAKFATLQTRCLSCHQSFRQAFREHFYEQ